jgi:DUF1680 family protein
MIHEGSASHTVRSLAAQVLPSRYRDAEDAAFRYLMDLDPDRLLAPYLEEAQLDPVLDAEGHPVPRYPNWESTGMGGHMLGHYLSGLSGFRSLRDDPRITERTAHVLADLARCQSCADDGYVAGIPRGRELFKELRHGDVRAQTFELNGAWVPLYNLHKLFAGLLDVSHAFAGDGETGLGQKASDILTNLATWWCAFSEDISDSAFKRLLTCEYGGMADVLARLYMETDEDRYLTAAMRFGEDDLLESLQQGGACLTGMHANTQIPKILGYESLWKATGDDRYRQAVDVFWKSVVNERTVSIGGHSVAEHFNPVDDFSTMVASRQGLETCNSFNMMRLAERLFLAEGGEEYISFYERVLENHIISTVDTSIPGFVYFTPMRPLHYRVYSQAQKCFWCCVGTGLECHSRYGGLVYTSATKGELAVMNAGARGGTRTQAVQVNLFIPTRVQLLDGVTVEQTDAVVGSERDRCDLLLRSTCRARLVLFVRRPSWVRTGKVSCEGASTWSVDGYAEAGVDYLAISVEWAGQARIGIDQTVRFNVEHLPDGEEWVSFVRGPRVLAQRNGEEDQPGLVADSSRAGHIASGPARKLADAPIIQNGWRLVEEESDGGIGARETGVSAVGVEQRSRRENYRLATGTGEEVLLEPFADLSLCRYTVYFPYAQAGEAQAQTRRRVLRAADDQEANRTARLLDAVACGSQQSEVDHRYTGRLDESLVVEGHRCRHARACGRFSYELEDWERTGTAIEVTLLSSSGDRPYRLLVEGEEVPRVAREEGGGDTLVDRYRVHRGFLGRGTDMSARVEIQAGPEVGTPGIHEIALVG